MPPAQPAAEPAVPVGPALKVLAFAGGGVLLAASLDQALRRLRQRRWRERTLGRTLSSTPVELAPMEKALLACGAAGAPDVTWLHTALTSLAQAVASDPGGALPDVVAVRLDADALELVLTTARRDAPRPWQADPAGLRWSVTRTDPLPVHPGIEVSAPYPTLTTVGHGPQGEHWLLDLERVGALSLTGDRDRCLQLARFLAAELAHNAWSDQLLVTLVGFGAELAGLNPSRVAHRNSVGEATREARATLRETAQVLADADTTVLEGRLRQGLVGDGWSPHVVLVAPGADAGPDGLLALLDDIRAQRSRTAVALVLAADDEHHAATRWQVHLDAGGLLTIPELGVQITAQQLPVQEAADLAALLRLAAQSPDVAMPMAAGDQPWDALADAAGAPRPELTQARADTEQPHTGQRPAPLRAADTRTGERAAGGRARGEERAAAAGQANSDRGVDVDTDEQVGRRGPGSSVLPLPAATYLASTATTPEDVTSLAPAVDPQVRRHVEDIDPALDADLRLWRDPASGIAKLTLLGPVSISDASGAPTNVRRDRVVEVVAFLACRPQGVTTEQWIEQMWPGEAQVPASRPRSYANSARQWLGRDPRTGLEYLPRATDGPGKVGSYRLRGVLVDADLFRRLRLRGVARGADGIADLEAALQLVAGEPMSRLRASGGAWLVDTPVQHHYTAMIVDVAHLIATYHLAAADPARAEAAAQTSLLAGSQDDVALLDLVAVKDAAGEQAQAEQYVARILANHDADVEEDLPPRTYEVLRRRRWLPKHDARAS